MTTRKTISTVHLPSASAETLERCLVNFVAAANGNDRVKSILRGWNPLIVIHAIDTGRSFHFAVNDLAVSEPVMGEASAPHEVILEAEEELLRKIFTGAMNPVRAHMDGILAAFATDRDNVKLDAICMVLWGM